MKKKWIWGVAVVLALALSIGLYKFLTADDYRRTLPSRPLALAAVDVYKRQTWIFAMRE